MLSFVPRFNFGSSNFGGDQNAGVGGEDSARRANLVGQILAMNPTASAEFLSQFDCDELGEYLEHLESAARPRGRMARWVRRGNTPGIHSDWRN
jgi:hypothetical protein